MKNERRNLGVLLALKLTLGTSNFGDWVVQVVGADFEDNIIGFTEGLGRRRRSICRLLSFEMMH